MNNPDHIFESLETIFWVKILKFFVADPGSEMEKIRIRDKHSGSATLVSYCLLSCKGQVPYFYIIACLQQEYFNSFLSILTEFVVVLAGCD
jgi:hypothetical protein